MNRKSIFGIFLIIIALSLTLGAVNAEKITVTDGVDNKMLSVEENVAADELLSADSDESIQSVDSGTNGSNVAIADLEVNILPTVSDESENEIIWSVLVHNKGPDTAYNTQVTLECTDNMIFENPFNTLTFLSTPSSFSYYESKGIFNYHQLTWLIGDLEADSYTELFVKSIKQSGQSYFSVFAISDSIDQDLSDNYGVESVGYPTNSSQNLSVNEALHDNPSVTDLPAAGNPFIVALLALMVIGVGGIKIIF